MEYKWSISGLRFIFQNWKDLYNFSPLAFSLSYYIRKYLEENEFLISLAIANDSRTNGMVLKIFLTSVFRLNGIKIVDYGCIPTPSFLIAVKNSNCSIGLMITASHNPVEWNGIKFVNHFGEFVDENFLNSAKKVVEKEIWHTQNLLIQDKFFKYSHKQLNFHVDSCFSYFKFFLDYEKIKTKKFYIIYDPANGPIKYLMIRFFAFLNISSKEIHGNLYLSERDPEPSEANLKILKKYVPESKADLGLAFDKDGDRLALISDLGEAVGEEYTLFLALYAYLTFFPACDFVVNLSSSRIFDDLAKHFKVKVFRSAVGEYHVLNLMKSKNITIGGEGNGGMILRSFNSSRDPLPAILLILNLLIAEELKFSQLLNKILKDLSITPYKFLKFKLTYKDNLNFSYDDTIFNSIYTHIQNMYPENTPMVLIDGIRIDQERYWFHLRPSNTEPCFRVFIEGLDLEEILAVKNNILTLLKTFQIFKI